MSGGNPFRVPYGFAIGRANGLNYRFGPTVSGTAGLFKEGAVTADVTIGSLFYANNSSAVTVVALTSNLYSSNTGSNEGRLIRIVVLDTATAIAHGQGNIYLAGTGNFGGIGIAPIFLDLLQTKGNWYEVNRSPSTTQDYNSVNLSGTTNTSVNANGITTVIVTQTGSATQFSAISGGYIGQVLNVVFANSAGSTVTVTSGGGLVFENTAGVIVRGTGGAFAFVKTAANTWYMLAGNSKKLN